MSKRPPGERPVIGLTLDAEEPGGYSKLPWYALRKNYFAALAEAGALPVALPHHPELAEAYLDRVDGLLVTGGAFDVDPALWGGGEPHPKVTLKPGRTDFELAATRDALAAIFLGRGFGRRVHAAQASTKARRISGSAGSTPYSGCHCTPSAKRRPGASIPSISPSEARALTTSPVGTAFTAW